MRYNFRSKHIKIYFYFVNAKALGIALKVFFGALTTTIYSDHAFLPYLGNYFPLLFFLTKVFFMV